MKFLKKNKNYLVAILFITSCLILMFFYYTGDVLRFVDKASYVEIHSWRLDEELVWSKEIEPDHYNRLVDMIKAAEYTESILSQEEKEEWDRLTTGGGYGYHGEYTWLTLIFYNRKGTCIGKIQIVQEDVITVNDVLYSVNPEWDYSWLYELVSGRHDWISNE